LSANVIDAYHFLIDNYEPGDDLYFFGFSRGAFTARSVAGLVRNCGILRPENRDRINDAYRLYRNTKDKPAGMTSTLFRSAFSYEPTIEFVGVWDTVGALGIPPVGLGILHPIFNWVNKRWSFHDTELSSHVHGAYQALAIDERRRAFKPTLWKRQPGATQILEQVWFTGVHCNVGGGMADSSLSDLALLWMVSKAQHHGLAFKDNAFKPRPPGDAGELKPGEEATFTVAPRPITLPSPSFTLLYRLTGLPFDRPIGAETGDDGGHGQNVAETAVQLREKKPDEYRPKELIAYLASAGRPAPAKIPLAYTPRRSPDLANR
jgi:T6SS, Phospholipase effector Tle1-like, catalytic domain